jgi:hypothetical protein
MLMSGSLPQELLGVSRRRSLRSRCCALSTGDSSCIYVNCILCLTRWKILAFPWLIHLAVDIELAIIVSTPAMHSPGSCLTLLLTNSSNPVVQRIEYVQLVLMMTLPPSADKC